MKDEGWRTKAGMDCMGTEISMAFGTAMLGVNTEFDVLILRWRYCIKQ